MIVILLSCLAWSLRLLSLHFIWGWNEKWLGKALIRRELGENSIFKGSKEENTSLNLLSILIIKPLMFSPWQWVRELRERGYWVRSLEDLDSRRDCKIWLCGSECTLNWAWPLSLWKWRLMGMRPTMASTPNKGEV